MSHISTTQQQLINRMTEISFQVGRAEAQNAPTPKGSEQMLEVLWSHLIASLVDDAELAAIFGDEKEAEHLDLIAQVELKLRHSRADGRRSVLAELVL